MTYNPQEYWQQRLSKHFDLRSVGHISFDQKYNQYLYALKLSGLEYMMNKHDIDVEGKSICDIGCGTGVFVDYFNKKCVRQVIGVDIAPVSIQHLKSLFPTFDFIVADVSKEPIGMADKVDIVNAFDIFYHITENALFEYALNNTSGILKTGGIAFITDAFGRKDSSPARHVHFRSWQTWNKALAKNNMRVLDIAPLYYSMNRVFAPPLLLDKVSPLLYKLGMVLRRIGLPNGMNIKLLVTRKE